MRTKVTGSQKGEWKNTPIVFVCVLSLVPFPLPLSLPFYFPVYLGGGGRGILSSIDSLASPCFKNPRAGNIQKEPVSSVEQDFGFDPLAPIPNKIVFFFSSIDSLLNYTYFLLLHNKEK